MRIKQGGLVAGVIVISSLIGYFTFLHGDAGTSSLSISNRITHIEQQQQNHYKILNEKIDRIAGLVQLGKTGVFAKRAADDFNAAQNKDSSTPQQREAWERQYRQRLDARFESQTVDAKWSLESTRAIESALTAESLKDAGALPPDAQNIQCRATMCRIQLDYADYDGTGVAGMTINAAIADRMPYTQVSSQPRSDGGVEYVIYAMRDEMGSNPR